MEIRVLRHRSGMECPLCRLSRFCDDCGLCEACGFSAPEVDGPHPPAPAPMIPCPECGGTACHDRACSVTRLAAMN